MTLFVHRDEYLLPAQHMHCIMLFVNNVAYADCLRGVVDGLTDPNDLNATPKQLESIHDYYTQLLSIPI